MPLTPGTKLGQYEVLEPIGAGGMGEVYRARDTKLRRDVAIKVLPEEFSRDQERMERFEREARLLAQLNHSNIATLHGLEEHDGQQFLVMEMVEGETLAERIAKGPIPLDEAIPLFIQIAEGLEAAHEKSIIHRDLKPANIKIGPDGKPKILDFGLAKAFVGGEASALDSSHSPTLTKGTALGAIMGTASYMSPEQARAKGLDKRTDIWAFGCCLHEALSGRKAFDGETVTDVLSAIISREPDMKALPAVTPVGVRRLLGRCMDKNARSRLRDIGEARVVLLSVDSEAGRQPVAALTAGSKTSSLPLVWLSLALACGAFLGFLARSSLSPSPEPPPLRRASIQLPSGLNLAFGEMARPSMALSPDGSLLVFAAVPEGERARWRFDARLYLRPLSEAQAVAIEDTEGAWAPFFSPDGRWVGFFAGGFLKKVSVTGGGAIALCPVSGAWGAEWQEDGTILFSDVTGSANMLFRVSAEGGEPEVVSTIDVESGSLEYDFPQALPGGDTLLVTSWTGGSFADSRIESLSLDTGETATVLEGGGLARYLPTGHLVYSRASRLLAVPFDLASTTTVGTPVPVVDDVLAEHYFQTPQFAVSTSGVLVYAAGAIVSEQPSMIWLDAAGSEVIFDDQPAGRPRLSPEGDRIAFETYVENEDVWIHDLRSQQFTRLTSSPVSELLPEWTADGERVLFYSLNRDRSGVFLKSSPESEAELVFRDEYTLQSLSSSADGKWLAYARNSPGDTDVMLIELGGSTPMEGLPLVASRFGEQNPRFAPVAPLSPTSRTRPADPRSGCAASRETRANRRCGCLVKVANFPYGPVMGVRCTSTMARG